MEKRCANMLILFRFIVSSGLDDFWADTNSNLTIGASSSRFKCLSRLPIRPTNIPQLVRYGVAVPDELVRRRASLYLPDQSHLLQPQSSVLRSLRIAPQDRDRSFGEGGVGKLAYFGSEIIPVSADDQPIAIALGESTEPTSLKQMLLDRRTAMLKRYPWKPGLYLSFVGSIRGESFSLHFSPLASPRPLRCARHHSHA
jgi:hypothetical protein